MKEFIHGGSSCPGKDPQIRRFLFWKYKVPYPHIYKVLKVGQSIPYHCNDFNIDIECVNCGKRIVQHFIEHEQLIKIGYTKEDIRSFRGNKVF